MKTIKITEQAHKKLSEIQNSCYQKTGIKYTFSEILEKVYDWEFKSEKNTFDMKKENILKAIREQEKIEKQFEVQNDKSKK